MATSDCTQGPVAYSGAIGRLPPSQVNLRRSYGTASRMHTQRTAFGPDDAGTAHDALSRHPPTDSAGVPQRCSARAALSRKEPRWPFQQARRSKYTLDADKAGLMACGQTVVQS
jgi:hypothetical protein